MIKMNTEKVKLELAKKLEQTHVTHYADSNFCANSVELIMSAVYLETLYTLEKHTKYEFEQLSKMFVELITREL